MEALAIYIHTTKIYWNQILILLAVLTGWFIACMLYQGKQKKLLPMIFFYPLAALASLILCRILYWYTHLEQFSSLGNVFENLGTNAYLMPGILIATYLCAVLCSFIPAIPSRWALLDAVAPVIALLMAVIRFSHLYTSECRGKYILQGSFLHHLPFSVVNEQGDYVFAAFFISFILFILIFIVTLPVAMKKKPKEEGYVFRLFLVLYSASEIFIDSTRNDASHLYFPGEALANLNKGAGFMGISQLLGALLLIYVMIYVTVRGGKIQKGKTKKALHILLLITCWITFLLGLSLAGGAEYWVQRHSSLFAGCYLVQIGGIILMSVSALLPYRIRKTRKQKPIKETS